MLTALVLLAVVLVIFAAAVVATTGADLLVDVPANGPDLGLPRGPIQPEDVAEVRFGLALRGYRMVEVDRALERLASELAARDAHVGDLQRQLADVIEPALAKLEAAQPQPAVESSLEPSAAAPVTHDLPSGPEGVAGSDAEPEADLREAVEAVEGPWAEVVHDPTPEPSAAASWLASVPPYQDLDQPDRPQELSVAAPVAEEASTGQPDPHLQQAPAATPPVEVAADSATGAPEETDAGAATAPAAGPAAAPAPVPQAGPRWSADADRVESAAPDAPSGYAAEDREARPPGQAETGQVEPGPAETSVTATPSESSTVLPGPESDSTDLSPEPDETPGLTGQSWPEPPPASPEGETDDDLGFPEVWAAEPAGELPDAQEAPWGTGEHRRTDSSGGGANPV